jgi:hypothetical protein
VDWRPFSSFTIVDETENSPFVLTFTNDFAPAEGGTLATLRLLTDPPEMWSAVADELLHVLVESSEALERLLVDQPAATVTP